MTQEEKIQALAGQVLEQSRARIAAQYSQWQADAEMVKVIPGNLYTKIDRGPEHNMSGMLMIEHATGNVYGIKAYGKVHKGHQYGTLDTIGDWYWGEYGPRKREAVSVAEYQHTDDGILFRVTGVLPWGIVYVHRSPDGTLRAETFRGRPMEGVPAEARAAVEDYVKNGGEL
jgi:hypothetical protein